MTVIETTDELPSVLELDHVQMRYPGPPEVLALADATFCVQPGEYVAITGPSGSGKSTLLNVLGLLARPTSGRYRLHGVDVAGLTEKSRAGARAHWVGTVFQAFHLLTDRSAVDNVMMGSLYSGHAGSHADLVQRAQRELDRVGLSHRYRATPSTLSGGEKQRVAIARALFARPHVLLCDEPTGNLDSHSASGVLDLFDELNAQGQTVVVITHAPEVATRAHRRLAVFDGVVREGP